MGAQVSSGQPVSKDKNQVVIPELSGTLGIGVAPEIDANSGLPVATPINIRPKEPLGAPYLLHHKRVIFRGEFEKFKQLHPINGYVLEIQTYGPISKGTTINIFQGQSEVPDHVVKLAGDIDRTGYALDLDDPCVALFQSGGEVYLVPVDIERQRNSPLSGNPVLPWIRIVRCEHLRS